jgi:hypothetical protein
MYDRRESERDSMIRIPKPVELPRNQQQALLNRAFEILACRAAFDARSGLVVRRRFMLFLADDDAPAVDEQSSRYACAV